MDITINEWFYYYLLDETEHKKADYIFGYIYEKCDKIVFLKGSPMNEKMNLLAKQNYPKQRESVRNFCRIFYNNSKKQIILDKSELPELPDDIAAIVHHKDIFLVRTCLATKDKIIITKDPDLKNAVNGKHGINVKFVEEFIEEIGDTIQEGDS